MRKLVALLLLLVAGSAFAQFGGRRNGFASGPTGGNCLVPGYRGSGIEDGPAPRNIDRSGFVYARIRYHIQPYWQGGELPWHHDYPDGDTMLPTYLDKLTAAKSSPESFQIVDIDSKELFQYPFAYLSEPGYLDLSPADVKNLREYLDRGGFLFVDDFRGNSADNSQMENFQEQLQKIYPGRMLSTIPSTHPIFHVFYDIDPANMLPPYRMFNSGDVQFLGMSDDQDRLAILVDFNNDASEYWQALDVGTCSLHESGLAVELGINYAIYALTH